jgi:hypothetical protein
MDYLTHKGIPNVSGDKYRALLLKALPAGLDNG